MILIHFLKEIGKVAINHWIRETAAKLGNDRGYIAVLRKTCRHAYIKGAN